MKTIEIKEEDIIRGVDNKLYLNIEKISHKIPASIILERGKKEIQAIIDCISDGIYITDGEGYTLMYNKASGEYLKEEVPNIIGKNVREMVSEGYWSESLSLEVIKQKKKISKIQIVNEQEILSTSIPYYKDGKIDMIISTDRNVSDLAALSKQLSKTEETLKKYEVGLDYYIKQNAGKDKIIYKSKAMEDLLEYVKRAAAQDVTILIQGESGVGKEVLSNFIHKNSQRRNEAYIKINCATIPESLIESELFGYEKGTFTGAEQKGKPGLFEIANNGTMLLDEITELPMNMQSKLLRVLQEKEIMRVGGRSNIPVNVRIIAATNINLKRAIAEGKFREDLFYRLNIVPVEIPPLRERKEDIQEMVLCFLYELNKKYHMKKKISVEGLNIFEEYQWPGNVRELKNVMERLIITSEKDVITEKQIFSQIYNESALNKDTAIDPQKTLYEQIEEFEKGLLRSTYELTGSGSETARMLGINKSTVSKKFKKYGIY